MGNASRPAIVDVRLQASSSCAATSLVACVSHAVVTPLRHLATDCSSHVGSPMPRHEYALGEDGDWDIASGRESDMLDDLCHDGPLMKGKECVCVLIAAPLPQMYQRDI